MGRGWLIVGLLLVLGTLSVPASVFAAEGHEAAAAAPGHAAAHEEQKPDNFFEGVVDLSIWTIVVFLILLYILNRYAWPMMREGLDKREQAVAAALLNAQKAQAEADQARQELNRKMSHAADEIRAMMEEARRNAQQTTDDMITRARADVQADRDRLRREIQTAQDQAFTELWTQAGQLATLVSSKVLGRQLSEEDHRRLVDEALADLRGAADERQRGQAGLA